MFGTMDLAYKVAMERHEELAREAARRGPIYVALRESRKAKKSRLAERLAGLLAVRVRSGKGIAPTAKLAPEQ